MRVLRGYDGEEIVRWILPRGLEVADCITFANIRGLDRPQDIIVKSRYTKIWAFTNTWNMLWEWPPGGKELGLGELVLCVAGKDLVEIRVVANVPEPEPGGDDEDEG